MSSKLIESYEICVYCIFLLSEQLLGIYFGMAGLIAPGIDLKIDSNFSSYKKVKRNDYFHEIYDCCCYEVRSP